MLDRHGWTVDQWNSQTPAQKAIVEASLEYWNEERRRASKRH